MMGEKRSLRVEASQRRSAARLGPLLPALIVAALAPLGGTAFAQSEAIDPARRPAELPAGAEKREKPLAYLGDDAEMNEAITKARRTLPRFVSIHQSRLKAPEKLSFWVMAAVDDGAGGYEYRWMKDVILRPDAIAGVMAGEGSESAPLKEGDAYVAHPDTVADWMVQTESGAVIGGYTLRVLVARGDAETQAKHKGRFLD